MDVKTMCLGALTLGPATGYEIRKMFEEGPFAHFHEASYGSIYPALSKLLEDGLVVLTEGPQSGRPEKKTYAITQAGERAFAHHLSKTPDRDRIRSETLFMLFFANFLGQDHLAEVFDGYAATYRGSIDKLEDLNCEGVTQGRRFVRGLGLAMYKAAAAYMEENRSTFLSEMAGRPVGEAPQPAIPVRRAAGGAE